VAALLAPLRDAYWCKALECPPEPAFMVPIDPDLALGQYSDVSISYSSGEDDQEENSGFAKDGSGPLGMWPKAGLSLQRAVAAAQKRRWLLPNDPEAAMHLGVLRFFNKDYIMAQQELTRAAELAQGEEERATLSVLCEKARLLAQIENGRGDIE